MSTCKPVITSEILFYPRDGNRPSKLLVLFRYKVRNDHQTFLFRHLGANDDLKMGGCWDKRTSWGENLIVLLTEVFNT